MAVEGVGEQKLESLPIWHWLDVYLMVAGHSDAALVIQVDETVCADPHGSSLA